MASASEADRVAQVFIWKQGSAPDLEYARHVLGVVNPSTARLVDQGNPPLQLYAIEGTWPDEPWERAIADMRAVPSPDGSQWTDTSRYDLAGWQGTDGATGERLFTVTAYRRAAPPATFTGSSVSAPQSPPPSIPQMPYYPRFPTGPVTWPPGPEDGAPGGTTTAYRAGGAPTENNPLVTNPLNRLDQPPASGDGGPEEGPAANSYAPYYAGFSTRLGAALIDIFFVSLFQLGTIVGLFWKSSTVKSPYLSDWLAETWLFICLGLVLFFLYHAVQLSIWGQTIGKRLMSIKVVSAHGGLPGVGQILFRMIGYAFSLAVGGWGFIMVALDPRRQGLHDRIAQTFVVPEKAPALVIPGLPGYAIAPGGLSSLKSAPGERTIWETKAPALGMAMAAVASPQPHSMIDLATMPEEAGTSTAELENTLPDPREKHTSPGVARQETRVLTEHEARFHPLSSASTMPRGPVTDMNIEASYHQTDFLSRSERARALFKQGLAEMERGALRPSSGSQVDPSAARAAAYAFQEALLLVPNSVAYRYFCAVALRYSASFEVSLREFDQVLALDPNHYEARQQIAYGQRWHDAFAYPSWVSPAPVSIGMTLPPPLAALLPPDRQPVTRLVLLREGGNKIVTLMSRTPRAEWGAGATGATEVPARIHLKLSRTPPGPIVAIYVVLQDKPQDPYLGETFLNPHDPDHPTGDACLLGQHMLGQLARQDRTYLIFVDEANRLLLSRKLVFDAQTQVSITRIQFEAQTLPPQALDAGRFSEAARWHMEHFPLDEIKAGSSGC